MAARRSAAVIRDRVPFFFSVRDVTVLTD